MGSRVGKTIVWRVRAERDACCTNWVGVFVTAISWHLSVKGAIKGHTPFILSFFFLTEKVVTLLSSLQLIHQHVIDTSLLYRREFGQRFKLKVLAEAVLK